MTKKTTSPSRRTTVSSASVQMFQRGLAWSFNV